MDLDSDDEDLFVQYQLKPVNRLTIEDGLRIKKKVLKQAKLSFSKKNTPVSDGCIEVIDISHDTENVIFDVDSVTKSVKRKQANVSKTVSSSINNTLTGKYHKIKRTAAIRENKFDDDISCSQQNLPTQVSTTPPSNVVTPQVNSKEDNGSSRIGTTPQKSSKASHGRTPHHITPRHNLQKKGTPGSKKDGAGAFSPGNTPQKLLTDYFQTISPKSSPSSVKRKNTSPPASIESQESITLSPSIRKNRKRFKSVGGAGESPSPGKSVIKTIKNVPRKKLFHKTVECSESAPQMEVPGTPAIPENLFPQNVPSLRGSMPSEKDLEPLLATAESMPIPNPALAVEADICTNCTEVQNGFDAAVFTRMIHEVMEQQLRLKQMMAYLENQEFASLLSPEDIQIMEKYTDLKETSKTLYMRMFFRKAGWHRVSAIKYQDLGQFLEPVVYDLNLAGFFDINIEEMPVKKQLSLLKIEEVRNLCKLYSISNITSRKRDDLIDAIIADSVKQRSVADMFKARRCSRLDDVAGRARNNLGLCFQLNEDCKNVFSRVVVLFSLVHDVDDETKRATEQRLLLHQVMGGMIRFVPYTLSPTVIFATREDFLEYVEAIKLRSAFETALVTKNFPDFKRLLEIAHNYFTSLVVNQEYCERISQLPNWLKRYCAGSVYASILTQGCENFKSKTENSSSILSYLLDQTHFGFGSRGKWYDLLAQAYVSEKQYIEAACVILRSGQDEAVNDVWKCYLQLRAQNLIKGKKPKICDKNILESLDEFSTLTVQEPASVEINAKALPGNVQGSKLVYVQDTAFGKSYSSVEEQAIYYYKRNGFTEGIHAEGFIVSTIFYLLFFKNIYLTTVAGVFQSPYQVRPLDMYTSDFYRNRRNAIDCQLEEMTTWTMRDVADRIESVFAEYIDTAGVITWKEYLSPRLLCDIIDCLGIHAVIKICERFIYAPRQARSGFPDLTLWNNQTKICKFVEVKSPKDRLSPKQRVWMDYLRKAGIDCEVCNVKNVAAKKVQETTSNS